MYEEFFGLREKPFNLTPSPRFLYLSEGHREALALLRYGVMDRKGFILLTGEVGTGKTTMVRTLLDDLNHTVKYVLLSNPIMSPNDFMNYLALTAFKKKIHFHSKAHFLLVFEPYLKKALNSHENFNLIIDEAHKLSFELLEEIRLLSNMETGDDKLINIFLVGQPELNKKLSDPKCRPLLQRISIRHHIHPLNLEETREYVATRLNVAGAEKRNQIFSRKAVEAIYDFSRGYPREINILADNALLLGYSRGTKKITPSMVKECYEEMRLPAPSPQARVQETEKGRNERTQKRANWQTGKLEKGERESDAEPVETRLEPIESDIEQAETDLEHVERSRTIRFWKWAAALLFFLAFSVLASTPVGKDIIGRFNAIIASTYQGAVAKITETSSSKQNEAEREISKVPVANRIEAQRPQTANITGKTNKADTEEPPTEMTAENKIGAVGVQEAPIGKIEDEGKTESKDIALAQPNETKSPIENKRKEASRIIIVGRGDTLSGLTRKIYGTTSDDIIELVKDANPGLRNIHFLKPGQKITLPALSQATEERENATFTVHIASYKLYEPALSMYRDLLENGYEAYILPKDDPEKGKIFRVTLGYFKSKREAKDYARTILKQGTSTYAMPIEVEGTQ